MKNLFLFLRKNYFYFFALLLETIALILFFQYNEYPNSIFFSACQKISGTILSVKNEVNEYFSLRNTNRQLAEELAKIYSRTKEAYYFADTCKYVYNDSLRFQQFSYISAKVISNTINRRNNFMMINKGQMHGIKLYMGVIMGNKIVGQVVGISKHFSWIMSVLNKDSRISAKIKKNNQLVNVIWNGGNYKIGEVQEIPKHVYIKQGDTIITSGNSSIFPEGIIIGTITENKIDQDENFNRADIEFITDFNSLEYVIVVLDLMRTEKEELEEKFVKNNLEN
jgi:rod shape-determining protein MreC